MTTEPLDTDALRLAVDGHDPAHGYLWAHGTLHLLIDELEATRAERDYLLTAEAADAMLREALSRAERAEALAHEWKHSCLAARSHAAEAEATIKTLEAQCRSYHSALERAEAEAAQWRDLNRCTNEGPCACNYRAVVAEAAIARVEALDFEPIDGAQWVRETVRAAFRGDQ